MSFSRELAAPWIGTRRPDATAIRQAMRVCLRMRRFKRWLHERLLDETPTAFRPKVPLGQRLLPAGPTYPCHPPNSKPSLQGTQANCLRLFPSFHPPSLRILHPGLYLRCSDDSAPPRSRGTARRRAIPATVVVAIPPWCPLSTVDRHGRCATDNEPPPRWPWRYFCLRSLYFSSDSHSLSVVAGEPTRTEPLTSNLGIAPCPTRW